MKKKVKTVKTKKQNKGKGTRKRSVAELRAIHAYYKGDYAVGGSSTPKSKNSKPKTKPKLTSKTKTTSKVKKVVKRENTKKMPKFIKVGASSNAEVVSSMPKGYRELKGAITQPKGTTWICNNKSLFSGEFKSKILITDKELFNKQVQSGKVKLVNGGVNKCKKK